MANTNTTKLKCVFGCKQYSSLNQVPPNGECRENWRKQLNLKALRSNHKVCDKHFQTIDSLQSNNGKLPSNISSDNNHQSHTKKCVLRCKSFTRLHKVPLSPSFRDKWREKLNLKSLLKSHRVCSNHFKKAKTKFIRTRGMPDTPPRQEEENGNTTENNFTEEESMKSIGICESPVYEVEYLEEEEEEPDSISDEALDDDIIQIYMDAMEETNKASENIGNNLKNKAGSKQKLKQSLPEIKNRTNEEDLNKSIEHELALLNDGCENDTNFEPHPNSTKKVSLTIERVENIEEDSIVISDDDDSLDDLEGQFRAIDNDSLIVKELEDKIKKRAFDVRRSSTLGAPIYIPSRSHALQSWLKTSDFCIVRRTKRS